MSLINEALKKAQKLRTGDPTTQPPMPGGSARVTKHRAPRTTQQLVLIAAGALALIVLSVVGTFWFVNRSPAPAPKPVAAKPAETPPASAPAVAPLVKTETPPPVETSAAPAVTPAPAASAPSTTAPATKVAEAPPPTTPPPAVETTPPPVANTSAPTPAPAAPAAGNDPRVHAFIDALKVMGIRSSGGDSRVLMNDRVFRVNDIVERNLGLRLTNVAPDALTFTDATGAVYVKNF